MASWTLDDIPWDRFDRTRLEPALVAVAKAAALVEYNGGDYAQYLCRIFRDDAGFQETARRWGSEEIQHGEALGRWAQLADPGFDFADACRRFTAGFRVDLEAETSVRGSRTGEMLARCVVETGTSSFYTALGEATDEPVLKEICRRIAADEFRHYKLFYATLKQYLAREPVGLFRRLAIAAGRIAETDDDELAWAWHAANDDVALPYDRKRCSEAYAARAYAVYRAHHVERGIAMVFKAVGLEPQGRASSLATRAAWWIMRNRQQRYARAAA